MAGKSNLKLFHLTSHNKEKYVTKTESQLGNRLMLPVLGAGLRMSANSRLIGSSQFRHNWIKTFGLA